MIEGAMRVLSSFAVRDTDEAQAFYRDVLDLEVAQNAMGVLEITLPGGHVVLAYPKSDHAPATYTVLNLVVEDVDAAVNLLASRGVAFQRYDGFGQDEKGIARGRGPSIAWFPDPSGNILAVYSET